MLISSQNITSYVIVIWKQIVLGKLQLMCILCAIKIYTFLLYEL